MTQCIMCKRKLVPIKNDWSTRCMHKLCWEKKNFPWKFCPITGKKLCK